MVAAAPLDPIACPNAARIGGQMPMLRVGRRSGADGTQGT